MTTLCECGCGQPVPLAKTTDPRWGHIKGQPVRFIQYHNNTVQGVNAPHWKGGRGKHSEGYIMIHRPEHPRANHNRVYEHIVVAEQALGKPLPKGALVHHVDGNPSNNTNGNLVICPGDAYHHLIHRRMRALQACGHANWRKCSYCKVYDNPTVMWVHPKGHRAYHRACSAAFLRRWVSTQKGKPSHA